MRRCPLVVTYLFAVAAIWFSDGGLRLGWVLGVTLFTMSLPILGTATEEALASTRREKR